MNDSEFNALSDRYGIEFANEKDKSDVSSQINNLLHSFSSLLQLPDENPPNKDFASSRTWEYPSPADNLYNAWRIRCNIRQSPTDPSQQSLQSQSQPQNNQPQSNQSQSQSQTNKSQSQSHSQTNKLLSSKRIAIKDNVSVSGVPMSVGSVVLDGFVPCRDDATIVTRLLNAGATLVGKTNLECFSLGGGSYSSFYGPVLNPIPLGTYIGIVQPVNNSNITLTTLINHL